MTSAPPLSRDEARALVTADLDTLLLEAGRARQRRFGNRVHLCAITNARSGSCSEDCAFCAQSAHSRAASPAHAMRAADELVRDAREADRQCVSCFGMVTSGRAAVTGDERARLLDALRTARGSMRACVSASIGALDDGIIAALKDAGITRIHHNLETSRRFFPRICTTHSYDERLDTVRRALAAGLDVCCGGLFGMGEEWDDRIDLAFELRGLGIRSVPVNFLNPVAGTHLAAQPLLAPREALRIIAVFRLILPDAHISVAGGRQVVLRDLQSWIFHAGASGMMIGNYLTTAGRNVDDDLAMLADLGLEPEGK